MSEIKKELSEEIGMANPGEDKPKEEYKLPIVNYPKLDMPEPPKTGLPEDRPHISCDSDFYYTMPQGVTVKDPTPGKARILIAIPVLSFSYEFVESFLKFWTQLCTMKSDKIEVGFQFAYRKPVHLAEIQLAEIALWNKCTHILFMDDDIYDVKLEDLMKLVDADKEVIGGVMHASSFPHAMCVFRKYNTDLKLIDMPTDNSMYRLYEIPCLCTECGVGLAHWDTKFCPVCGKPQDQSIQKADLIPFAFTLMKTSIFAKMKRPWFHCTDKYPTDSWFADRCIESGIQEFAHMEVRLNHRGITDTTKPYHAQMGLDKTRATGGVVTLTKEDMDKHQFMLHHKMLEAEEKLKTKPLMVEGKV